MADPVRPLHISAFDNPPDFRAGDKAPVDAGDPVQRKEKLKEAKSAEQILKETVRGMMLTEANRKYVYDLLASCNIYGNSFASDPYKTAFNLGEQNIGRRILADLQLSCPDLYLVMLEEQKENG